MCTNSNVSCLSNGNTFCTEKCVDNNNEITYGISLYGLLGWIVNFTLITINSSSTALYQNKVYQSLDSLHNLSRLHCLV